MLPPPLPSADQAGVPVHQIALQPGTQSKERASKVARHQCDARARPEEERRAGVPPPHHPQLAPSFLPLSQVAHRPTFYQCNLLA